MSSNETNFITEEEAELYDRQIRLWGADVQRSLRNLKILVIGLKGVAAEVCKNLILSGVHSLTMMDPEKVVPQDLHSQYFLNPKSVGENRAQASLNSAQILNPNVKVSADVSSPLDKPISYYSNFDVVCVTSQSPSLVICLNEICKLYDVKFLSGDSFGMFGYLFEDFGVRTNNCAKISLPSFRTALNYNWTPKTSVKRRKFEDPSFLLFKILTDFQALHKRNPMRNDQDRKLLMVLKKNISQKYNADDILSDEYLENVFGEFGPTCSIIGGMIAQNIVKSLSGVDPSITYDLYFFNHLRTQLTGMMVKEENSTQIITEKSNGVSAESESIVELEV